jgi:hypothetical protein
MTFMNPSASERTLSLRLLLATFFLVAWLTACAGSPAPVQDTGRDPNAPNRTLIGLEDDPVDVWKDWTASSTVASVPEALPSLAVAFDFWRIGDEPFRREAWEVVFTVLSTMRTLADADMAEAMTLLMSAYDPAYAGAEVDVTFVVDRSRSWEGLLIRLWTPFEDTTLGTTVLLRRHADGPHRPLDILVWGVTGFEDNRGFTAHLEDNGTLGLWPGVVWPDAPPKTEEQVSKIVWLVFVESLWKPLTGNAYIESTLMTDGEGSKGFEEAAGLERRERLIEEVFSNSVFPPRIGDLPF